MTKKIKGAVVGLGYWGPNLIRNLSKVKNTEIKTACDLQYGRLLKIKNDYPAIETTNDFNIILQDPEISFVAVATPLSSHYILAKQALLAGKHVLIEKPMTQSSEQAEELNNIAQKQNKVLMVGHTFLYSPAVIKIKKSIANKSFGKLLYFDSTRINLGRLQADTNVIWDLATHDLSILLFLFSSMPNKVQAMGSSHISNKNTEIAHIFLTFNNNITAHIHVSWLSPVKIRNILIGGSKQMIQFNDIEPSEKIKIYDKRVTLKSDEITPFTPAYRSGGVIIPPISQQEALFIELEHFINCIRNNKTPLSDAVQGLKVVKLLEAIEKSINNNTPIYLNEKKYQ